MPDPVQNPRTTSPEEIPPEIQQQQPMTLLDIIRHASVAAHPDNQTPPAGAPPAPTAQVPAPATPAPVSAPAPAAAASPDQGSLLSAALASAAQQGAEQPPDPTYTPMGAASSSEPTNDYGQQHLRDLVAQQAALQPKPHSRLRQIVTAAAPLAGLAMLPLAHGGPGAPAGVAEGVAGQEQSSANLAEKRREEQVQQRATLQQQIELERRAQEQESNQRSIEQQRLQGTEAGLTLRQKMAEDAETGRNARLIETIQGQNQRNANTVAGAGERTDKTIAGAEGRQERTIQSAQDLERIRQQGRMQLEQARGVIQRDVAQIHANLANDPNKLTPQMRGMVQQAGALLPEIDRIDGQIDGVASQLGPAAGRWNEFWQGKVGANDPKFAAFKDDVGFLETGVALAHARGRMSDTIFNHFQSMFDAGKQDPANMHAAMQVAKQWMTDYANLPQTLGRQQQQTPQQPQVPKPPRPAKPGMKWQYSPSTKQLYEVPAPNAPR